MAKSTLPGVESLGSTLRSKHSRRFVRVCWELGGPDIQTVRRFSLWFPFNLPEKGTAAEHTLPIKSFGKVANRESIQETPAWILLSATPHGEVRCRGRWCLGATRQKNTENAEPECEFEVHDT